MSKETCFCLVPLGPNIWTLPCGHKFHPRCIRKVYDFNVNHIDDGAWTRLTPLCPLCRAIIHKADVPSRRSCIHQKIINTPAISAMPVDARPLRLARETFVAVRERTRKLIDDLIAKRSALLKLQVSNEENTAGPSGLCNSGARRTNKGPVLVSSSSSSSSSQECVEPPRIPLAIPKYLSQLSDTSRSRSPLSQPAASPFQRFSQELQLEGIYRPPEEGSPLLHPFTELQDVQMHISILQTQLETVEQAKAGAQDIELVEISDNESVLSGVDEPDHVKPEEIVCHVGRGQHIKYLVRWSDELRTLNKCKEVEQSTPDLLAIYRRKIRARNTRLCRQRKKALEADIQSRRRNSGN